MVNFPELNQVVEGRSIADSWRFYTINVIYLGSMTHAEFESEFPKSAEIISKLDTKIKRLEKLLGEEE